jgi:hypothetical protein
MRIVARVPHSRAASDSACAWLPDDAAQTPSSDPSAASVATALNAPRNLNAPTRCSPSAFSATRAPTCSSSVRDRTTGVRCATPARRPAARRTSASVGASVTAIRGRYRRDSVRISVAVPRDVRRMRVT